MIARRTQKERRETTIRKLLDAATETLVAVGYADASVQRVCERAEVSQGALFRHFPTREALMAAVGRDVSARTIDRFRKDFKRLGKTSAPLEGAMALVRARCRSRLNQAWYELSMAARTRPALRKALAPVLAAYREAIDALARELLPEAASSLGEAFPALVELVIAVFDGESVERFVAARPKADAARMDLLRALVTLTARELPAITARG